MAIYETVTTTQLLDNLIHDVAVSIKDKDDGKVEVSAQGGETFVYDLTPDTIALGREYISVSV